MTHVILTKQYYSTFLGTGFGVCAVCGRKRLYVIYLNFSLEVFELCRVTVRLVKCLVTRLDGYVHSEMRF